MSSFQVEIEKKEGKKEMQKERDLPQNNGHS